VTLTTPLLGVVCHRRLGFDTVYLHAKFYDFSFNHSRDIIGASKFKVGHVLRVICLAPFLRYSEGLVENRQFEPPPPLFGAP